MSGDTIFALATPPGRAAIAILRVSGPATRFGLETIAGSVPRARVASLRVLKHPVTGEPLDQALVIWFPGPSSFTGEDMAELHVHGGRAVVAGVLDALSGLGWRPAGAGEFTRRAFANGKADLTAVEGLADLIDAQTEAQRRQAMRQLSGDLARTVAEWRAPLLDAMARIEADIDFSDEDDVVQSNHLPGIVGQLRRIAGEMASMLAASRRGERLRDGLVAVLAGPPNAGKSTLLNTLAGRDVAIVSDVPGTTRDAIEVPLDLRGFPVTVIDTAGLRDAADAIEREGVRRSRDRMASADIVVWLTPADAYEQARDVRPGTTLIEIATKIDSVSKPAGDGRLGVSCVTGEGFDSFLQRLSDAAADSVGESSLLTRARHREAVQRACEALVRAAEGLMPDRLELAAEDLRIAVRSLEMLVGRVGVEDVLDRLFASFCIGK